MNTDVSRYTRWLPAVLLLLAWLTLWLTGLWLKPPRPDESIAVVRVNGVYLDGRRFNCVSMSESNAFALDCVLTVPAGVLRVQTLTDQAGRCLAIWQGSHLQCLLRGFGYFNVIAEIPAHAEVAAHFAPGDVTLVALGANEQAWLWIGLGILALTSLLAVGAAWAWARSLPKWRILSAGLVLIWLLPINLFVVVANYAGMAMID